MASHRLYTLRVDDETEAALQTLLTRAKASFADAGYRGHISRNAIISEAIVEAAKRVSKPEGSE